MGDPALAAKKDHGAAVAALLVLLVLLPGCNTLGMARRTFREPGPKLIDLPAKVALQHDCATRRLPYFVFEGQEVNPDRLIAGEEFNHRFVYALCPRKATEVVKGSLRTRIRYKDRIIVQDKDDGFELQPGRWAVDSFIRLPDDATLGIYSIEIDFKGRHVKFRHEATFGVDAP